MRPVVRGAVAGAIGGLAGTWAMNHAQRWWTLAVVGHPPRSTADRHDARDWQERHEHRNSNEMAAQAIANLVIDRPLTCAELSIAARVVHFGFGAAVGAVHGVFAEQTAVRRQSGLRLGATLWLAADEIAMPVLGLSESTIRRPLEMHLQSFTAHLVYGVIAEHTRWVARSLMPGAPVARCTTQTPSQCIESNNFQERGAR